MPQTGWNIVQTSPLSKKTIMLHFVATFLRNVQHIVGLFVGILSLQYAKSMYLKLTWSLNIWSFHSMIWWCCNTLAEIKKTLMNTFSRTWKYSMGFLSCCMRQQFFLLYHKLLLTVSSVWKWFQMWHHSRSSWPGAVASMAEGWAGSRFHPATTSLHPIMIISSLDLFPAHLSKKQIIYFLAMLFWW